jgi:hypothetical protein
MESLEFKKHIKKPLKFFNNNFDFLIKNPFYDANDAILRICY